jgi:GT2 family glycosyltransferase
LAAGCRVVHVGPRLIAAVRNGGAASASGEYLAFVDADMQIHAETFNAMLRALTEQRVAGGASGIRPERWSVGIGTAFLVTTAIGRVTGLDAGLAYLRRRDFESLGGYDERRASLEDVDLLWRLQAMGRQQGRRLVRLPGAPAIFSTRKFDQRGDWHWIGLGARVLLSGGWRANRRPAVVERYWYDSH